MGAMGQVLSQPGTGLDIAGSLLQGISGFKGSNAQAQLSQYQAVVAANNATIQRQNADSELVSGQYGEIASKLKYGALRGSQAAAQAANGLDINIGSPLAVRTSTAELGSIDAALIHYNAAKAAFGSQQSAANYDQASKMFAKAASDEKAAGFDSVAKSLISGFTSVADRYSKYQQSGVK